MNIPDLKLNETYYIFTFGTGGKYVKFIKPFSKIYINSDILYCVYNHSRYSTKEFSNEEHVLSLSVFNNSLLIHESDFKKYKEIIRIPALNLSKRQLDFYKRQISLDNIINNI